MEEISKKLNHIKLNYSEQLYVKVIQYTLDNPSGKALYFPVDKLRNGEITFHNSEKIWFKIDGYLPLKIQISDEYIEIFKKYIKMLQSSYSLDLTYTFTCELNNKYELQDCWVSDIEGNIITLNFKIINDI